MNRAFVLSLFLLIGGLVLGGCATMGVQPWERGLMSEPAMQVDPNPIQSAYDDHIYFSIEGSSGGRSFGGGGCGCN
ncbi:MAG: DUF4266 domain-containing protein [Elusimicrobiota bacterium]